MSIKDASFLSMLIDQLLAIIAPVALCSLAGFAWVRMGLALNTRELTPLITYLGTPCLIVSALLKAEIDPQVLVDTAGAAMAVLVANLVIAWWLLRQMQLSQRAFLPSLVFGNTGNMGLPICLFAYGEQGLALALPFFTIALLGQFSIGIAVAAGQFRPLALLGNPVLWSVVVAVVLMVLDVQLPLWADNTLTLLGQFTIPLMLLALGAALANLRVTAVPRAVLLSLLRLGLGFGLGLGAGLAFGLEGVALGALIIESTMPVAVFNYLFAQLHDNRPEEVAGVVLISTLMSFATLPLLLAWLLG